MNNTLKTFAIILCLFLMLSLCACTMISREPVVVDVTPEPAAEVKIEPTPMPTPDPTPIPTPDLLLAGESVSTVAWISDTQHYSELMPEYFYRITEYIASERERLNLSYIVHTGDFVQNYSEDAEWETASRAMDSIDGIPCGVLAGNHDVSHSKLKYDKFAEFFSERGYSSSPWFGDEYGDGMAHYDLITVGETDFIFGYVGFGNDSGAMRFIRKAFQAYPGRVGVLCAHSYFNTDTTIDEDGEELFDKIVSRCDNVYLVLCGHRYNQYCQSVQVDTGEDGTRTVYQMMANYQAAGDFGGDGYIRFMQFDDVLHEIRMYSYSPVKDDYNYFDTPESQLEKYPADPAYEQYTIPMPWYGSFDAHTEPAA